MVGLGLLLQSAVQRIPLESSKVLATFDGGICAPDFASEIHPPDLSSSDSPADSSFRSDAAQVAAGDMRVIDLADASSSDSGSGDKESTYDVGCIGWSEKLKAALCVLGDYVNDCFTHRWDWSMQVVPSGTVLASDSKERTPEERHDHPDVIESIDHMLAPSQEVEPTVEKDKFEHTFHVLATLGPRQTLDLLLTTQEGKPPQWLRFRWSQTNAGNNRISMRCLPQGQSPPAIPAGELRVYDTKDAPPLPPGVRGTEVDLFAYEGGPEGSLSIKSTPTRTSLVVEHTELASSECQSRESHSASVINLARGCIAGSAGSAAEGLRRR